MRRYIGFRLREGLDVDLAVALEGVEQKEISNLCREGLRKMLGIKDAIVEPIQVVPITIKSKPAIFIPKNKRGGGQL